MASNRPTGESELVPGDPPGLSLGVSIPNWNNARRPMDHQTLEIRSGLRRERAGGHDIHDPVSALGYGIALV